MAATSTGAGEQTATETIADKREFTDSDGTVEVEVEEDACKQNGNQGVTRVTTTTPDEDDFDDFGDFSSTSVPEPHPTPPSVPPPAIITPPSVKDPPTPASTAEVYPSASREGYERLIRTVFKPHEIAEPQDAEQSQWTHRTIDHELSETSPPIISWTHIQNFEASHCLLFKWVNSNIHQRLLKCLNITKASTIMYSAKWGAVEVPKFATSLLDMPLQPEPAPQSQSGAGASEESEFDNFQSHREGHS